jgi:IS30 family transposase
MSGGGLRWTGDEEDRLRSMFQQGKPIEEIARCLGRTAESAGAKAKRLGLLNKRNVRRRWTAHDQSELRRMAAEGMDEVAIAGALGRSPSGIKDRLIAMRRYIEIP